jgi:hypothetical protein
MCMSCISAQFPYQQDVEDIKSRVLLSNNSNISGEPQERIVLPLVNISLKI